MSTPAVSTVGGGLRVQVSLPNGAGMLVQVNDGDNPVAEIKRQVAARAKISPLQARVSAPQSSGPVDSLSSQVLHVVVTTRAERKPSHQLRVQLMSEQRVAGVSAWDVPVDPSSDSVMDLKFLLATQPAFVQAGIKPDYMRLYARRAGSVARSELLDGQTLREAGALHLPAVSCVRVMFEIPSGVAGHGNIHSCRPNFLRARDPALTTMGEVFLNSVKVHGHKPCLGMRSYLNVEKPTERGPYTFISYAEAGARAANIGAGLRALGIQAKDTVGIISANRTEWTLTDMACSLQAFISVPLYDTLGPDAIQFILNHSSVRVVIASVKELAHLQKIRSKTPALEHIVVMDDTAYDKHLLSTADRSLYTHRLSELEELGSRALDRFPGGVSLCKPSDILTLCYTSGTTGNPKGAVLTQANVIAASAGLQERATEDELAEGQFFFSYLPLAHIYERSSQALVLSQGSAIGFGVGDPTRLLEDVAALRPTMFPGVPRVWQRIYDKVNAQASGAGFPKAQLFSKAYNSKLAKLHKGELDATAHIDGGIWDKLVFSKIQALFGGRMRLMSSGAAPLSPKVADFMRTVFGAHFVEGYGLTETAAALTCSSRDDCYYGAVGTPLDCNTVKLVDVPDMEYFSTDYPQPRGEIWVCGPNVFAGYYKQPDVTAEVFEVDAAGRKWFKTGDIGTWLPDGALKIIDRKKNLFKLSQGEYIRPEHIEGVYKQTPQLANVFVHGDSNENFLVAIVYPEAEALKEFCKQNGIKGATIKDQVADPRVEAWLFDLMEATAKREKLRGFEAVRRIYVSGEDFGVENGLLTPTMKLKRNEAKKYFATHIKRMYTEGEKKIAGAADKIKSKL